MAAMYKQPEAVKMLLSNEINPRSKDNAGRNPLHLASKEANDDVVNVYIEECVAIYGKEFLINLVQDEDIKEETSLLMAIKSSNIAIVQLLIPFFNKNSIRELDKVFPVHSAAITGNIDLIEILLDYGANISALNLANKSPLYVAAENNIVQVINFLIDQ